MRVTDWIPVNSCERALSAVCRESFARRAPTITRDLQAPHRVLALRVQQARPARSGGDDPVRVAPAPDVLRRQAFAAVDGDVRQPLQLTPAPVEAAPPACQSGQARLEAQAAADLLRRLRHGHLVTAPAERQRALEACGTRADHQNRGRTARRGDALGVPPATPLLADRRVLSAAHRHRVGPARDADVAADALADVLLAALVDFPGKERIRDRGSRRADQVEHAAFDLTDHGVRGGETADADHRLACELLDELDDRLMAALGRG